MTTKQTTTQQGTYNTGSMGAFNTMTPVASSAMTSEINDPYSNMFFNNQLAMQNQQIAQLGATNQASTAQSLQSRGMSANSPLSAYLSRLGAMNTSSMQSGAFNNLLLSAANLRQGAISGALNYKPLQTGQTQTQTTGGTGTWLPQVIGAGVQAGLGVASMGMSDGGGSFAAPSTASMFQPGGLMNNFNPYMSSPSYTPGMGYNNPNAFGNAFMPGTGPS